LTRHARGGTTDHYAKRRSTALRAACLCGSSDQVVVFTATVNSVAPGSGTPAGSVDFKEGATDLTPGGVTMAGGSEQPTHTIPRIGWTIPSYDARSMALCF
jgi:hypothetical protein